MARLGDQLLYRQQTRRLALGAQEHRLALAGRRLGHSDDRAGRPEETRHSAGGDRPGHGRPGVSLHPLKARAELKADHKASSHRAGLRYCSRATREVSRISSERDS